MSIDPLSTKSALPSRHVHNRTYFVGIVRSKVSELESEIHRLQRETTSFSEDNKQYLTLSKTAEDLSQQVKNLRNECEDYNMARMNSFCDVTELKKEIDDLAAHNGQVESTFEEIYREKQRKEERIQQLENEFFDVKPKPESSLENMNLESKQHYSQLTSTSNRLQTERQSMQNEISTLESRITKIREQMPNITVKQEALSLIEQIYELELKHEQLLNENKTLFTSEDEHQKLSAQIESDNQELASIEKQIITLQKNNENPPSFPDNTQQNYSELQTQEKQIDEFFSFYQQTQQQYLNDIQNIQKQNLTLLTLINRTIVKDQHFPTRNDYTQLKTNADQYEIEKQKSNNTLIILVEQHRKLKQDYIKLETLDQRLANELQELKIHYTKMQEDLDKFNDLESLKRKAERRKQQLLADKTNMIKQREITQTEIQTLQSHYESMQSQLQNNETHQQLISLDKKFQTISQTLFTLDETFALQNVQDQYEQVKRQALELVQAHNRWLIERLKNPSTV